MKKIFLPFIALTLVALTTGCSKDEQPVKSKSICEIGNTGKVVSSCNVLSGKDGSPNTIASNMAFWYCPDCSRITAYDLSEGIPGMLMKDYSFVLHGDAVVDNSGEVVFNGFKFNDKGYVSHLVDFKEFSTSQGTTHVTFDIVYNDEDRMSKITYNFLDADEKPTRIQNIDLLWEGGLLKSVQFDNNG